MQIKSYLSASDRTVRQRPRNKRDLGFPNCHLPDLHPDTWEKNVSNTYRIHHTQVMPTRPQPPLTPKSATELTS
ncbi:hypothetical protein [Streptomyces sp. IMTB 2501]|uniref:hypothetical protein n=1 Tax=Streptomyces sp. IMTB 2501 TaxID=1776340 RepID=UPI0011807BA3|nr:hypothetical protein [Streptomyces sp. IMTB 2501]